jgi:polyisoprenoid-binding protein YceI
VTQDKQTRGEFCAQAWQAAAVASFASSPGTAIGQVLNGPATRALHQLQTRLTNDVSDDYALRMRWARLILAGFLLLAPNAGAASPNSWRVSQAEIRVLCPLTVGGSFEAKTEALTGSVSLATARPAAFVGALSADLRALDSGIGLRNEHMRGNYLEVGKGAGFDKAVISDIHLGDVDAESFSGRTRFTGTLALHGARAPVKGQAEIQREGSRIRIEASFLLALVDFGIAKPQYLGVGVKSEIQVTVSFVAVAAEEVR